MSCVLYINNISSVILFKFWYFALKEFNSSNKCFLFHRVATHSTTLKFFKKLRLAFLLIFMTLRKPSIENYVMFFEYLKFYVYIYSFYSVEAQLNFPPPDYHCLIRWFLTLFLLSKSGNSVFKQFLKSPCDFSVHKSEITILMRTLLFFNFH